jgi:sn-glycerol 3-phosphate transport system substrate-binding protein
MNRTTRRSLLGTAAAGLALRGISHAAEAVTEISFYSPVAVGGPITRIIDGYAADFQRETPTIKVTPIYAGTYQDTLIKAQTALKANAGPSMAVLLSTDAFSLIDDDLIVPFDTLADSDADRAWLRSFYPAFLRNGEIDGHTWGVPFQRSTIVLYWNKEAFQQAGLDPERPPETWEEESAYAQKLTRRDGAGNATQWGMQIPSSGFPYWLFQALTTQNDAILMNQAGDRTFFDKPAVIEALQRWVDLGRTLKVMAPGVIEWGTTPKDFFERQTAMMWTTTGNLTNVRNNAKFPFGVAMLPAGRRRGTPTGGGNFYIFKKTSRAQQEAAVRFAQWMTTPERAAQWGIDTGYVAVRPDAWRTPVMQKYVESFPPAAVARDQLQYAVAELSTHDNQRVTKALNDGLQAALTGAKKPEQAMKDAQAEAERLLKPYR